MLKQNFIAGLVKLIEYSAPAFNVFFNPCVGTLPRIKIYFPLWSMCTDELISNPKIITFLTTLPTVKQCYPWLSNPIP